jgi:putative AdoMet-dependent methyltransferase
VNHLPAFPAWYFDEFKMAGVDFHDSAQVAAYDRNQTASTPNKEQALVDRLGIGANHRVLDISPAMLRYAQTKADRAGVDIAFHQAGFLTYAHPGPLADVVVCKNALHILPDFWKMVALQRMSAMLQPHGMFYLRDVVFSFPPTDYAAAIDQWIAAVAKPDGEGWIAKDFAMHVREEHSTYSWILESMLTRAGFEIRAANYLAPTYAEYLCGRGR